MPGILYVVATPIGNLEDVTLRAIRVLREVSVIAAEDTRRTARLLQHYSISTPTTSLHEHNERARTPALIRRLEEGQSVALVSDAGTPIVSDPGAFLVAEAHRAGIRVEPVPGPSAAIAALSASGFSAGQVLFVGFPPSRSKDRKIWLQELADEARIIVLFEAPHRIRDTLVDIQHLLGDRPIMLGRELTKLHEQLAVRPISQILALLADPRGEFVVVLPPQDRVDRAAIPLPTGDILKCEFDRMTENGGGSRRDVVRELAAKYRVSSKTMYRLLEQVKISGK
jgi:16S rRNA (cytidine1402-2'-O)-methyltransferase